MISVCLVDDQTLVGAYVSKDLLKKAIAAARNPPASLGADAGIAKTAALLPQGSQWVGYINPKGVVDFGVRIAKMVMPAPGESFPIWATDGIPVLIACQGTTTLDLTAK